MATKYVEANLYTYAATPTWGSAQEGDGTAKGASTPATISVDMSTWVFTLGSSTFSIMGATAITITAGANSATNAQYSATYATMLANIVASINLATATNCANIPAGWNSTSQVRDRVFARVNGSNLELMTRAGSASWNGLVAVSFANVTGSSSQSWASGAGGAWGWLANFSATIWPSAIAVTGYGLWCAIRPNAGEMAAGDVIHVRCNNTVVTTSNGGNKNCAFSAFGTYALPITFIFGDPVVWSSDSSSSLFTISAPITGSDQVRIVAGSAFATVDGGKLSTGEPRLKITSTSTGGATLGLTDGGAQVVYKNIQLSHTTALTGTSQLLLKQTNSTGTYLNRMENIWLRQAPNSQPFISSSTNQSSAKLTNCVFDNQGATAAHTGVMGGALSRGTVFDNCKFVNFVTGSKMYVDAAVAPVQSCTEFRGCDLGNAVLALRQVSKTTPTGSHGYEHQQYVAVNSYGNTRDFLYDYIRGYTEHFAARTYPTLRAILLMVDGTTPYWSWRIGPSQSNLAISWDSPFIAPKITKVNTLGDNVLDVTLEFCVQNGLSFTRRDVSLEVAYKDSTGVFRIENTWDLAASALSSSSLTWSTGAGDVIFDDGGGNLTFIRKKLTLRTAYAVEADSEVAIFFRIHTSVATADNFLFVDPDPDMVVV